MADKIEMTDIFDKETIMAMNRFTKMVEQQKQLERLGFDSDMFLYELGKVDVKRPKPNTSRPIPNNLMVLYAYAHLDYLIERGKKQ